MNLEERRKCLVEELRSNLALLISSVKTLEYSYIKCEKIGIKKDYSMEELDFFEALTARFARTSDILTQKVFKTLIIILQEQAKTFIDKVNFLEKIGAIENADDLFKIRELRNNIAHEYIIQDVTELFKNVLECSLILFKSVDSVKKYIEQGYF